MDTFSPVGPQFNKKYKGNFFFNAKSDKARYHMTPTHKTNSTKFTKKDKLYILVKITNTPVDATTEPYIV